MEICMLPRHLIALALLTVATASPVAAQLEVSLEFSNEFGGFGFYEPSFPANQNPPTGFSSPRGLDFLSAEQLVIADYNNLKLQLCDLSGENCQWFGGDSGGRGRNSPGVFDRPHGVEVSVNGRIAVADEDNHWIQFCRLDGQCLFSGDSGSEVQLPSSSLGRWAFPDDVAIDSQGRLFGLDRDNNRIQILNPDTLNFTKVFMGAGSQPGQLNKARGIAIDRDDRIIISDTGNHRVQICDTAANCTAFGGQGSAPGQFNNPVGIDVDLQGRIWVADTGNNRIQVCNYQGQCRAFGAANGYSFLEPHDVAVHPSGKVAVADTGNSLIQVFTTESSLVVNGAFNDAWFDPATAGQGFFFTIYPELGRVFVANFTYDSERPPANVMAMLGEPGHRWLTGDGLLNGNEATLSVTLTSGGIFDSPTPRVSNETGYGSFEVEFISCDEIRLSYDLPAIPRTGTINLQRVSKDNVALCEALSGAP